MATTPTPFATDATDYKIPDSVMKKINEIASQYPEKNSAMLPALHLIQDEFGWIPPSAARQLADALDTTPNKVYAVISFYTMFNDKPVGKYHIQVCRGTACHVKGSDNVLQALERELKIGPGQTSRDGIFSLEVVACIGACGLAPVVAVNGKFFAGVTPEKVRKILEDYRKKAGEHEDE